MKTKTTAPSYKGFRFPPESINHAVWLYFRFSLSFRDVEELMAQRGVVVTYQTVGQWCLKFGQTYANELRTCHPRCGDKWSMDEVVLTSCGKKHSLWRTFDQQGTILDILVQSRGNKQAAKKFFRKLLKGFEYVPCVRITDTLASSGAAKRELLPGVEHRQHTRLNNRAEHSHHPTRLREKNMRRFTSARHAQRFLSAFGSLSSHFQPRRHRLRARDDRATLQNRFQVCNEGTGAKQSASSPPLSIRLLPFNTFLPRTQREASFLQTS